MPMLSLRSKTLPLRATRPQAAARSPRGLHPAGWPGLVLTLGLVLAGQAQAQTMPQTMSPSGPAAAQGASTAAPASARALAQRQVQHERELQAIRQALLEATLKGPTRVMSAAWIDEQGTLREISHFNSESRVEGVQVQAYLEDPDAGEPVVNAQVLTWAWPVQKEARCEQPPRPWRLPLQVHSQLETGLSGPQQWIARTLLEGASAHWLQHLAQSPRWLAQKAVPVTGNAYAQALSGTGQSPAGWGLTLSLGPAPVQAWEALSPVERYQRQGHWAFRLNLQLHERTTSAVATAERLQGPGLQMSQDFWVDPQALGSADIRAQADALLMRLQQRMEQWSQRLHNHFDCEPMRFAVHHEGSRRLLLQAGQGSGLRPGDRVLVLDPARIPSQMLEPAALSHLALAEVVRVHRHQTELQQLAGPALPPASTWVALPL